MTPCRIREVFPTALRYLLVTVSVLSLLGAPGYLGAQTPEPSQQRYLIELKQRNVDYGAGCNGIGVSVPGSVAIPAELTTRWVAGHSACIPGMRLVMSCGGEVVAAERIIGCLTFVADGGSAAVVACEAFTLLTPLGRFNPDPALSQILGEGSESRAQSCSAPAKFDQNRTVATAFAVPAVASTGDLAILIDLDGSEIPAFLVPAAQLQTEAFPSS